VALIWVIVHCGTCRESGES